MYMYIVCVERFDLTDNSLNTGVSRNDSCLNKVLISSEMIPLIVFRYRF